MADGEEVRFVVWGCKIYMLYVYFALRRLDQGSAIDCGKVSHFFDQYTGRAVWRCCLAVRNRGVNRRRRLQRYAGLITYLRASWTAAMAVSGQKGTRQQLQIHIIRSRIATPDSGNLLLALSLALSGKPRPEIECAQQTMSV